MSKRDINKIHVDRETEKRLFKQMIHDEVATHILLIQANSGLGKSSLLREFREMSHPIPTIFIDLEPHRASEDILFDCCFQVGQANFKRLYEVCQRITGTGGRSGIRPSEQRRELLRVLSEKFSMDELRLLCFYLDIPFDDIPGDTISRKAAELIMWVENRDRLQELLDWVRESRPQALDSYWVSNGEPELTQLLSTQVKTELANMSREQRLPFKSMLSAAFVDDLQQVYRRRQQSFAFLFDTFNQEIIVEVKEWIVDFLNRARIFRWLNVVVAGQMFPRLTFDDQVVCRQHILEPFQSKDVDEFARQLDLPLEPDNLKLLFDSTKGVPLTLAILLDNLSKLRTDQ